MNGGIVNIQANLIVGTNSLVNSSANVRIDAGSVTVGGMLMVGLNNGGRWSDVDITGGTLTVPDTINGISLGGPLAGNAILLVRGGTTTAGIINLGNAVADSVALVVTDGSLYVGQGGIVAGSAATATVTLNGGILGATTNWSSSVDMTLANDNGGVTIQAADASGNPQDIALSGALSGNTLNKTGSGTLTLSGANSYSGLTTVSNGTLFISTAHAGYGDVMVNDGTTFGVANVLSSSTSAEIANLTLGNSSGPTTLVFTNIADPSTPVLDASSGTVTLNGNCAIKIADKVNLTAPKEYPLLKYSSTIVTNSGAGFSLSLPLPPGVSAKLTNDTSIPAIALLVTGIAVTPPSFSSIVVSGHDLVFNATGGTPLATVYVLTSTNLVLPMAQWTTNSTTSFDSGGNLVNYTITGAVSSGQPKQFYRLKQ